MKKILLIIYILFCSFNYSYGAIKKDKVCFNGKDDVCFNVELAITDEELTRGLQFREVMFESSGMLFVFPVLAKYSFWMKNTLLPLDMIWINDRGEVVYIEKNVQPCKTEGCIVYQPDKEAIYVLEINAGLCDKFKIDLGDRAKIDIDF